MEFAEIKNKSAAELTELLKEQEAELYRLALAARTNQLKQVHKIKQVRRAVARIKTALAAVK